MKNSALLSVVFVELVLNPFQTNNLGVYGPLTLSFNMLAKQPLLSLEFWSGFRTSLWVVPSASLKVSLHLSLNSGTDKAHWMCQYGPDFHKSKSAISVPPLKALCALGELIENNSIFMQEIGRLVQVHPIDAIVMQWKAEWKHCDMKNNLIFRQYPWNTRKVLDELAWLTMLFWLNLEIFFILAFGWLYKLDWVAKKKYFLHHSLFKWSLLNSFLAAQRNFSQITWPFGGWFSYNKCRLVFFSH